ncbi:hypothetical protein [Pasteurella atlantica]|uniref:hypothetical protein n=1 Tax=Pasteurellaceae TaxID=712 RepID=UPI0027588165|nr:hypothetical protein [Pasteurella atlantica]MDP8098314.1 hypothetical protein [Pasteurella atlantica]MDP8106592.1 hypothetical protein [Pasteurella atlantica]MDP8116117.1 hypothetical protein [Pasteurella atlantica]
MNTLKNSYKGVYDIFRYYWKIYGGWKELLCSPYLHVAIFLLFLTHHQWLSRGWWDNSLSILPTLLGFSVGGFAIFLGLGDEVFRSILAEKDEHESFSTYTLVSSTFVHFIFVQCLAIIFALLAQSFAYQPNWLPDKFMLYFLYITPIFWGLGYLLFLYSIMTMLATVMAIFRCSKWYEEYQSNINNMED